MPYNLLLLPLLGGFTFLRFFIPTKPFFLRQEGYKLLIYSSLVGIILLSLSFKLSIVDSVKLQPIKCWWDYYVPFEHSGIATTSLLLGCCLPFALNVFISLFLRMTGLIDSVFNAKDIFKVMAMHKYGDSLELLLEKAVFEIKEVSITLKNNKVYIGMVTMYPQPHTKGLQFISILPYSSGFRDEKTKEITRTTDYVQIYDRLKDLMKIDPFLSESDFDIAIPISEILSINIHNQIVRDQFDDISSQKTINKKKP